ncbi:NTP transferase domain-containing protein [Acetobacter fallax]|uniref:NTP transferase domain-containing protein n=1 Tax=Acetobacter fallax TaxID=1737473 RepID=A0ABX0KAU8_9PROT|nr:NTP transferase domain-containing protein [Acetobacter fallax]NHO36465.1 NTP transferase domain-containing protein [Acetobacter fallax]
MSTPTLTALVLAGSRAGAADPMAVAAGLSHKALIPIAGKPMIRHVIDSLRATPGIARIVVCIETPEILTGILPPGIDTIAAAAGPSASVLAAIQRFGTPLLVTTADNPLLQPAWTEAFLAGAGQADVAVSVAKEDIVTRDVPGTARTFIRLSDVAFSGCNLFLFRTPVSARVAALWQRVERERKHPLRMGWLLGPTILLRFLLKRLDTKALLARITQLTGAKARFVFMPDGRAAVDVDKPADLDLVRSLMEPAFQTDR